MSTIGRLKEIDVRELWKHEQYDFSSWLSKENNIEYLNEILGLTLVDIDREVYVGPYRCDIVAKDETTGERIIIENQLEGTNHDHLGKIITYASGLNANVIVWIVKEAKEEHRAAVEWLNNNTVSGIDFFLIEIHAYKIGDSLPAPKFEVVERPNEFVKSGKTKSGDREQNKAQSERLVFWEQLNQAIIARGKPFNVRKAGTGSWYDVAIGTSSCHIAIDLINKDHSIIVEIYIPRDKDLFDRLYEYKDEIEEAAGVSFVWDRLEDKKASRIKYYIDGLDFEDHSNYDDLINQCIDMVVRMREVFKKYLLR